MKRNWGVICLLVALGITGFTGCSTKPQVLESNTIIPFVCYPVEKIHPDAIPTLIRETEIRIAGNEYELALIGIYNPTPIESAVSGIRLRVEGSAEGKLRIFEVGYMNVTRSTSWFRQSKGRWPDPLIPLTATSEGHGRSTPLNLTVDLEDPITVPPGENRLFLLELYLPADTPNNQTQITVRLTTPHGDTGAVRIIVNPYSFDLPRIPSLATAYGVDTNAITATHETLSSYPFDEDELHRSYFACLAEHQISLYQPGATQIVGVRGDDGELRFEWNDYEQITGGMLDGTLFPQLPPATTARIPRPPDGLDREEIVRFYREFASRARKNGWLDRMFFYLPDEPRRKEYPGVREVAALIKEADPEMRTLVTEPFTKRLEGYVDIWCVDIPVIGDSIRFIPLAFGHPRRIYFDRQWNPAPSRYRERQAEGETAWLYTCMSAQYLDYPNLFIDSSAAYQRVLPWLAYRYGFTGLLYYNVVRSYGAYDNPWASQYQFFSNGDGNLLYPGYPERPNIYAHKPIPSLRLKLFREGIEDYEYLIRYEKTAGRSAATEMAIQIASKSVRWEHDVPAIVDVRNAIAAEIEGD